MPFSSVLERLQQGARALVTVDNWFYAKDGQSYRAVWGRVRVHPAKEALGLEPRQSTNWYAEIGDDDAVLIAGCQIHYVQLCDKAPIGSHVLKLG